MNRLIKILLQPVPHYDRFGLYSQSLIIIGCLFCFQWWPLIPTVAIGFLAVVTTIMAVRAEKFSHGERVVYVLIAFALFFFEMKAIYDDRKQNDLEQAGIRKEENEHFERVLAQNQKHFEGTLTKMSDLGTLSKQAIKSSSAALQQITGGSQFCYLMGGFPTRLSTGTRAIQLAVLNSGPLPLDVCHVSLYENSPIKSAQDAERNMRVLYDKQLGPLPPGREGKEKGMKGFMTDFIAQEGSYYIQINTRNHRFYETLTLHPGVKGKGIESIEIRNEEWKLVYSEP